MRGVHARQAAPRRLESRALRVWCEAARTQKMAPMNVTTNHFLFASTVTSKSVSLRQIRMGSMK